MSTKLWFYSVTSDDILKNLEGQENEYLELSQDFLYEFFVNEELMKRALTEQEIEIIRPNWGEIQLKSTDTLVGEDWQEYLRLLQEVMQTNSMKNLDSYLYEKGISSDRLADRAKSPAAVMAIVQKLIQELKKHPALHNHFIDEIDELMDFLERTIDHKDLILIEFMD